MNLLSSPTIRRCILAGISSALSSQAGAAILLQENFDGLVLNAFVSATEKGGDGTDWTDVPPALWVRNNGTTPSGSPVEFFGWTFMDKNSWIATEGDQSRAKFLLGNSTVMIADPDAYDDGTNIDDTATTGLFNTWMTSRPLSLAGVPTNSILLELDSSFRAEPTQIAKLDISYDGGTTYSNLLTLDGSVVPDEERINEHLAFNLQNPSAGTLVVKFGLTNGSNDWWWAVDNFSLSTVPEPTSAMLGLVPLAGLLLRRRRA